LDGVHLDGEDDVDPDESVHGLGPELGWPGMNGASESVYGWTAAGTAFAAAIGKPKVLALAMNHSADDQQQDDGLIGNSGLRSTHS
jgi:hypothetical protein